MKILHFKKFCISILTFTAIFAGLISTAQIERSNQPGQQRKFQPVSLDEAAIPDYDFQRANKLPLTGYFEKSFDIDGTKRTAKFYISATAPVRAFFTAIAVPEKTETTEFMIASGWHDIADKNEEGLVFLEPGANGWQAPEKEQDYINAVFSFFKANSFFSIFGISYLAGYDAGGTALEAWAAANPLQVISQAYVNSQNISNSYFAQFDTVFMDGKSSGYVPLEIPEEIKFTCNKIPVPTAFVNSKLENVSNNISYWKKVNDISGQSFTKPDYFLGAEVFPQSSDSKAWATAYSGSISKVVTLKADVDIFNLEFTKTLYKFLSEYVSYDNSTAYGNHLAVRKNYGEIGTILVNGELREFQIYVPEKAPKIWPSGAPVLFVFAGNSQTDKIFFHNTLWWKIADEEGVILVIPCETYSNSSTSVSHANTGEFYEKLADYVTKYYPTDTTRFYATGQSAGSFACQGFGVTNPEYFAAIASTSGLSYPSDEAGFGRISFKEASNKFIPNYCIIGQGDIEMMTGTLWDNKTNMLDGWAAYFLKVNNAGPLGDGSNITENGRFRSWTWKNNQDFPVFKVGLTMYRAHNCIPAEMPLLWDFLKHWSYKNGIRYYDGIAVK